MIIETDFEQGSEEWLSARRKSVGGTSLSKIITSKGERSESRDDFVIEFASRVITGWAPVLPRWMWLASAMRIDTKRKVIEPNSRIRRRSPMRISSDANPAMVRIAVRGMPFWRFWRRVGKKPSREITAIRREAPKRVPEMALMVARRAPAMTS